MVLNAMCVGAAEKADTADGDLNEAPRLVGLPTGPVYLRVQMLAVEEESGSDGEGDGALRASKRPRLFDKSLRIDHPGSLSFAAVEGSEVQLDPDVRYASRVLIGKRIGRQITALKLFLRSISDMTLPVPADTDGNFYLFTYEANTVASGPGARPQSNHGTVMTLDGRQATFHGRGVELRMTITSVPSGPGGL